jgi:hypothetical protein
MQRRERVLELRIRGQCFSKIAGAVGISRQRAWTIANEAIDDLNQRCPEKAERMRRLEMERLTWGMACIADQVADGDTEAVREWRQLSESLRKLFGLDAPTKFAPTTPDGESEYSGLSDAELERELAASLAAAGEKAAASAPVSVEPTCTP